MTGKLRNLLLLTLFVGLTCGLTEVSAQTGGGKVLFEGGGAEDFAGGVSALAGKWVWGQTGSLTWALNGSYASRDGSRFTYQFSPDGTVQSTAAMHATMGSLAGRVQTPAR